MIRPGFSKVSYFTLAVLGGGFIVAAAALAPFSGLGRFWVIPAGFCIGLAAAFFAPKLSRLQNERMALIIVLGTTFITGAVWLLITRVSPDVGGARDFVRMFETAEAFAAGTSIPEPDYQAVFPHLLGYPFFLSLFFRVFGPSAAVAQTVNLLLSLCSALLLFFIGKRLMGIAGGLAAGLLWALVPSHFILLSMVANEPLHIALTLLAVWLYLPAYDRLSGRIPESAKCWALLGISVGLSALIRPYGPVYLLAFTLCAAVFAQKKWLNFAVSVLIMTAAYIIITLAGAVFFEKALDRPTARNGFGWNFYVGMNRDSSGNWSASDYELMAARLDEGLTAPEIQALFAKDAFERAGERFREGGVIRFMAKKFTGLWSSDRFTVYWLSLGMREDSPLDIRARAGGLGVLCNLIYGFLLGCCAFSLFRQVQANGEAFTLPVTLLIGFVLLFLLLEANPRYHYAGSSALCLLAAGCVIPAPRPAPGSESPLKRTPGVAG